MNEIIDIVIPWVDNSDITWQKEKKKYENNDSKDARDIRYRDWDLLEYLFRGIETNAPWVNKIHFITWGHIPEWMDQSHEKLNIVKHEDFIPRKYLPTFSSHTIELNMHRIKGLADKFIYFNDDIFIIDKVNTDLFFLNNLPRDAAVLRPNISTFRFSTSAIESNNLEIINTNYDFGKVLKSNYRKWFSLKYKRYLLNTILLLPYKKFPGFLNFHLPNAYLKSTFESLWEEEYEILNRTCLNKFRDGRDVNQWLFRYKQIVEGKFIPRYPVYGKTYSLTNNNEDICQAITTKKNKIICINDNNVETVNDFEKEKNLIKKKFETVFPDKSTFEL